MTAKQDPKYIQLVDDLIRAEDNVRGARGRDYQIACHVYEMAKRALTAYIKESGE